MTRFLVCVPRNLREDMRPAVDPPSLCPLAARVGRFTPCTSPVLHGTIKRNDNDGEGDMGNVTMWWEEGVSPIVLEVVTDEARFRAIVHARNEYGATAFCESCELSGWPLLERGFFYDFADSGVITCLKCAFDPTFIWGMLVRGDALDELAEPKGVHRATRLPPR